MRGIPHLIPTGTKRHWRELWTEVSEDKKTLAGCDMLGEKGPEMEMVAERETATLSTLITLAHPFLPVPAQPALSWSSE